MCGIVGIIDFRKKSSQAILEDCTNELAHRGPDGSGTKFFETDTCQVGLGHRRLSIIDLSNAAGQPMEYQGNWIVFNGEIYNYNEIRNALMQMGHQFTSHSDTEVILHAWQEWGAAMLQKFIGMFAFVIYDTNKNKVFCCRDRAGVKALYLLLEGRTFPVWLRIEGSGEAACFRKKY